jgi:magnesium-transporting ATPase (P-type)
VPRADDKQGTVPFERQYWEEEISRFASQGCAWLPPPVNRRTAGSTTLTHDDLREGLVFLGIAGMMDPPRPEAIDAIHACQNAGSA